MNEIVILLIYSVSVVLSAPPGSPPDITLSNAAAPGEIPTDREIRTSETGVSIQKPDAEVGSADPSTILRSAPAVPPSPSFPDPSAETLPASPSFSSPQEDAQPSPPMNDLVPATIPSAPVLPVRHPDAPPLLPFNPSAVPGPIGPDGRLDQANPAGPEENPQNNPMDNQPAPNIQPPSVVPSSPEEPAPSQPNQPGAAPQPQIQRGMQERGLGGGPGGWGIADAERAGLIQGKDLDSSKEGACSTCGPRNNFETPILERAKEQGVTPPPPGTNGQQQPDNIEVPRANKWPDPEPCDAIVDAFPSRLPPELALKADGYFKMTAYKPRPPPKPTPFYRPNRKPKFGEITIEARDAIIETCRRMDCRTESVRSVEKYNEIHRTETDIQRIFNPFITPDQVHRRLAKIHKLKRSLLDAAGLGDAVEPNNDGTFQDDILLTEGQIESMILRLRQQAERNRNKRSAIYVEQMPTNVWPPGSPIPVAFDNSLSENERFDLRMALSAIESSTCIRFQHYHERPGTHHIYFVKVATPTFCGLSYIGKVSPGNPIYLSFMCGDTVGVAIHEILHALGINHEHLRFDRDRYLNMEWENINPQLYDYFAVSDQTLYTTYGIPFDYSSIMLYGPYTGAIDHSRPAMKPVNDDGRKIQMMGQRKSLSERDVLLLNTMYCKPRDCMDQNVYCGLWALRKLCKDEPQSLWMQRHCRRSCGVC